MAKFPPTPEQAAAVAAFRSGGTVVIEAGAGAGKTSTLELIAKAAQDQGRSVLYIAFNRAIADEARRRFPANTTCSTAHALAFAAVGKRCAHRLRLPRQSAQQVARILGITRPIKLGSGVAPIAPQQAARLALGTVARFCATADRDITVRHVPVVAALDDAQQLVLARAILPFAQRAWDDLGRPDGQLRYTHDYYFKRWQHSGPRLNFDVIMLDECQDTDPVLADVFRAQAGHAQLVLVGDRQQAIYGWRGCIDIMGDFPDARIVQLTRSFRFGPAVAAEANRWLTLLGASLRITGHDPIPSRVGPVTRPDVVICRTNAGVVAELLAAHQAGLKVALVGGGKDIRSLAEAAIELQERGFTAHPELTGFASWQQVVDFVESDDHGSEDLRVGVALIERHGAHTVLDAINRLVDEREADIVLTTAHKAKGREWDRVRVGSDFREPTVEDGEPQLHREELMLAYVTVTRARLELDLGSLSWIDDYVEPGESEDAAAAAGEPEGSPVELAKARVDAARDPLARAVALLRLAGS